MRLAVTIWNGRISPVFDVARRILLLEVEGGREAVRREEALDNTDPGRLASSLTAYQPDVLVCGAISRGLATLLTASGIRVIPFVAGEVEPVIEAFRKGVLARPDWAMPGCCDPAGFGRRKGGRCGRGHCAGQGRSPAMDEPKQKEQNA
jgi:predicted Fe-Mo cluster-binding NifX family protein